MYMDKCRLPYFYGSSGFSVGDKGIVESRIC